jgi:hypothetical protein
MSTPTPLDIADTPVQPSRLYQGRLAHVASNYVLLSDDNRPYELPRAGTEQAVLSFDCSSRHFTETHIVESSEAHKLAPQDCLKRLKQLTAIRARSFPLVLQYGIQDNLFHYTTGLCDGEPLDDYLTKHGPMQPLQAFRLVHSLLNDLIYWSNRTVGVEQMSMNGLLMTLQGGSDWALMITDLGLHRPLSRPGENYAHQQLCVATCHVLIQLLTGRSMTQAGKQTLPALSCLTSGLRIVLRDSIYEPELVPASLLKLRYYLLDATASIAPPAHLPPLAPPHSPLLGTVLPEIPADFPALATILIPSEPPAEASLLNRYSMPGIDVRSGRSAMLNWLPSRRLLHYSDIPIVPSGVSKASPETVITPLSSWEGPETSWVMEPQIAGISLADLMASRHHLSVEETIEVLEQLQAVTRSIGVAILPMALHPANICLTVDGVDASIAQRKIRHTRLTRIPDLKLRLRLHRTAWDLTCMPLTEKADLCQNAQHAAMIGLAIYMLAGHGAQFEPLFYPSSVAQSTIVYLNQQLAMIGGDECLVTPEELVQALVVNITLDSTHYREPSPAKASAPQTARVLQRA